MPVFSGWNHPIAVAARSSYRHVQGAGIRPIVPYLVALFLGLVILALVPWLSIGFL